MESSSLRALQTAGDSIFLVTCTSQEKKIEVTGGCGTGERSSLHPRTRLDSCSMTSRAPSLLGIARDTQSERPSTCCAASRRGLCVVLEVSMQEQSSGMCLSLTAHYSASHQLVWTSVYPSASSYSRGFL